MPKYVRTIEDVRNLNDPQKAYNWIVFLPNLNDPNISSDNQSLGSRFEDRTRTIVTEQINQRASGILGGPLELIDRNQSKHGNSPKDRFNPSFQVEEVQGLALPGVDREAFYEAGRNRYKPGLEDQNPFTIIFHQDASSKIPEYIMKWKRRIVAEDGSKGLPNDYKKTIVVHFLNGRKQSVLKITLEGCFPTISTGYNLASSSSENVKLGQEFSYDRMLLEPIDDIDVDQTNQVGRRLFNKTREIINKEAGVDFLPPFPKELDAAITTDKIKGSLKI